MTRPLSLLLSLSTAAIAFAPAAALACGGLFCNNAQPVNQSAERIFFAREGETVHMHVQITYNGPPQDFGWLLPTAPDVETTLGSELLFTTLDQSYGPRFQLQREFSDRCAQAGRGVAVPSADGNDFAEGGGEDPGVQVLSREAVGPYDRAILEADNVEVLREWLDDNEFQIPETTDSVLAPYIEAGAVFVALKLLPGSDSGDVAPLVLSFTSSAQAVPIVPTSVAADPDMGIIVHLLATERSIPKNYAHVQINEAAIDWLNGGQNYADVVSQAADEAGGKAFTTDFAGDAGAIDQVRPFPEEQLTALGDAHTLRAVYEALGYNIDADAQRVLGAHVEVPEGVNAAQFFSCPDCFGDGAQWDAEVDGAAVAEALALVNPARAKLVELLVDNRYLTRLFTTMSAAEMDEDPLFALNPDLDEVSATRTATQFFDCDRDGNFVDSYIEAGGLRVAVDLENNQVDGAIQRENGETVRGTDTVGARLIEQLPEAGPSVVVEDRTPQLETRYDATFSGAGGGGCASACSTGDSAPTSTGLALLGLLFGIRRRRR